MTHRRRLPGVGMGRALTIIVAVVVILVSGATQVSG